MASPTLVAASRSRPLHASTSPSAPAFRLATSPFTPATDRSLRCSQRRLVVAYSAVDAPADDERHQHAVERPCREGECAPVRRKDLQPVGLYPDHRTPPSLRRAVGP